MKEADIFESWVNNLAEGTWALPDNPEAQAKLDKLMSDELIVGPDATNATEQLYDVVGDDQLFDILGDLADRDPRANIWDDTDVQRRLSELGIELKTAPEQTNDKELNEGHMAEVDQILQDVANGDEDIYRVYSQPRTREEAYAAKIIGDMYDEVVIDKHLHPDDDVEQILDIVAERLAQEHNVNEADNTATFVEGSFDKTPTDKLQKFWDSHKDEQRPAGVLASQLRAAAKELQKRKAGVTEMDYGTPDERPPYHGHGYPKGGKHRGPDVELGSDRIMRKDDMAKAGEDALNALYAALGKEPKKKGVEEVFAPAMTRQPTSPVKRIYDCYMDGMDAEEIGRFLRIEDTGMIQDVIDDIEARGGEPIGEEYDPSYDPDYRPYQKPEQDPDAWKQDRDLEEPSAPKTVTITNNAGKVVLTFPSTGGFYGDLRMAKEKGFDTDSGEYNINWSKNVAEDGKNEMSGRDGVWDSFYESDELARIKQLALLK